MTSSYKINKQKSEISRKENYLNKNKKSFKLFLFFFGAKEK